MNNLDNLTIEANKQSDITITIRPWVRYWARIFDLSLFSLIFFFMLGIVLGIIDTISPNGKILNLLEALLEANYLILHMVCCFIWIFVESLFLRFLGTTPGKTFLRVQLNTKNGNKINFRSALRRSLLVWYYGLGIGFPLVTIATLYSSYHDLTHKKITVWDEKAGFIITHKEIGIIRASLATIFIILIYIVPRLAENYFEK